MEIEAKYTVTNQEEFARLRAVSAFGDYQLRPGGEQELTDRYLDTDDRAIRRGGFACRLREKNGRWLAALKSLGGAQGALHAREEHEMEVPPGALPQEWPAGAARDLALGLAGTKEVGELFVIRQHRTVRTVWQGQRCVAEFSLDTVEVDAAGRVTVMHELEVELAADGTPDDLGAIGESLTGYAVEAQPHSKFERALALLNGRPGDTLEAEAGPLDEPAAEATKKPKNPGVRADESMGEAGRKILCFHWERVLAHEAGTREGVDIEALHDMRVATRRLRAAFRFFEPYFRRTRVRRVRSELGRLAEYLGAVRDMDVLLDAAKTYAASLEDSSSVGLQPLLDEWSRQRDLARRGLLTYLDGEGFRVLSQACQSILEKKSAGLKPAGKMPQPSLVRYALPGRLWDLYGIVCVYEAVLPGAPLETLHSLRIDAKRLRYALEFFREILDPRAQAAIEAVVSLQDHLGKLHDADVAIGLLHEFLMSGMVAPLRPEIVEETKKYAKFKHRQLQTLVRTVGRPWRKLAGRQFRLALAGAAAGL